MHRLWLSYYSAESGVVDTITLNRRYKDLLAPLMKKERYYHILDQLSGRDFGSVMADALRADLLNDNLTEEALENYLDYAAGQSGRPGPVLIDMPMDMFSREVEEDLWERTKKDSHITMKPVSGHGQGTAEKRDAL